MPLLPAESAPGGDLPARAAMPALLAALAADGAAVLVAPPGSGKTSLLPLALADALGSDGQGSDGRGSDGRSSDGRGTDRRGTVLVAEPRRLATRAAATRLASLVGERPGGLVGYAMRGERVPGTRVEVLTTGLLVRRLQREPDLPGVAAVVIDECHERQLDADLALAFCVDVRANLRADLALVATSATPDVAAMSRALGIDQQSVVTARTTAYEVRTVWAPPPRPLPLLADARVDPRLLHHVADVTRRALSECPGDVLVFVPGEGEITTVARLLQGVDAVVLPLFGRQTRAEQDRALTQAAGRRIVVTTAVAESSLTVPGVRVVVDAGLARRPYTDQNRGLSALITTRVSRSSADQRAGRAGREAPGVAYRCWSQTEHLHLDAFTAPEIATADLAEFALALAAWGAPGGHGLALLDRPPAPALDAATCLLQALDALDADGRITARGRRIAALPAHPRLARAVLDGADAVGAQRAREIVALLSDDSLAGRSDDLPARLRELRRGSDRAATARWRDQVRRLGEGRSDNRGSTSAAAMPDDLAAGTVVGLAYPDRIARLRRRDATTYLTTGGVGAALGPASDLRGTEWLAVADADRPAGRADARIRSAAPIDEATALAVAGELLVTVEDVTWDAGRLRARRLEQLGAIVLSDTEIAEPDPLRVITAVRDGLRADGVGSLPWRESALALRARLAFCHAHLGEPWPDVSDDALLTGLDAWLGPDLTRVRRAADLGRLDLTTALRRLLPWPQASRLEELVPERVTVPSGSHVRVQYDGDQPPVVAVKLQELLGSTSGPTVADGRVPVVLHLLSPAGRTVAITADLASFWTTGYPQVRADLRARYPRHPWPENPLDAVPTKRVKPRS